MWTDPSPMQAMREAVRPCLPPKAFLRRDRGEGLLVSNAPAFDPGLRSIPGFQLEIQGALMRILPDESWIVQLEAQTPQPPDSFCRTLMRFRGQKPERDNLLIFVQGAKLLDEGNSPTPAEIAAYDRALRRRCAEALRGGACGGGLYAAAILLAKINTLYKGDEPS